MQTRINAVLSDYDGTLSPTNRLSRNTDSIPEQLEGVLWEICQSIPVCVISSKDFHFLHSRTGFARILSCIMGIETISHSIHNKAPKEIEEGTNYSDSPSCARERYILPNSQKILQTNSVLLSKLAEIIELEFKGSVILERKFTSDRHFLAGITIAGFADKVGRILCRLPGRPLVPEGPHRTLPGGRVRKRNGRWRDIQPNGGDELRGF